MGGHLSEQLVPADGWGIRRAADLLRRGAAVAFPTETVYGLGANALSSAAVAEIYRLKRRPAWNPLIAHVPTTSAARGLAAEWPDSAEALAERFWPGPLTLVVRRAPHVPSTVSARTDTIAVRVPAHPIALALLDECGLPLAAPSANRSEAVSPTTPGHVLRSLPDVPLVLDGGPCRLGIESTVIDVRETVPRLLRPGALALRSVRDAVGEVHVTPVGVDVGAAAPAPGMSSRHYAPRAKLLIQARVDCSSAAHVGSPLGLLLHHEPGRRCRDVASHIEVLPADPQGYGADLYAALHRLDDAEVHTIVVQEPPPDEDWAAIRDRLTRAAA
jgi:L-threonylcarbamoyladenylate synthase